jgi:hypothetical protein
MMGRTVFKVAVEVVRRVMQARSYPSIIQPKSNNKPADTRIGFRYSVCMTPYMYGLWQVEWPTKLHEGSGGVLDWVSVVGVALRGFQRPFSR